MSTDDLVEIRRVAGPSRRMSVKRFRPAPQGWPAGHDLPPGPGRVRRYRPAGRPGRPSILAGAPGHIKAEQHAGE